MAEGAGRRSGGMFSARVERASRVLSFNAEIENIHPDFIAGSGFLRRTGETLVESRLGYNRYGQPGALVERWGPTLEYKGFWDHADFWSGNPWKEYELQIGTNVSFKNNFSIWTTVSRRAFQAEPGEYQGLWVGEADAGTPFRPDQALFDGLHGVRVFFSFSNWDQARGRIRFEWRETPLFEHLPERIRILRLATPSRCFLRLPKSFRVPVVGESAVRSDQPVEIAFPLKRHFLHKR